MLVSLCGVALEPLGLVLVFSLGLLKDVPEERSVALFSQLLENVINSAVINVAIFRIADSLHSPPGWSNPQQRMIVWDLRAGDREIDAVFTEPCWMHLSVIDVRTPPVSLQ